MAGPAGTSRGRVPIRSRRVPAQAAHGLAGVLPADRSARRHPPRVPSWRTGTTRRSMPSIRAGSRRSSSISARRAGPRVSLTKDRAMLENTMDSLRILADETDGRAIVNSNDLATGLRQIVRDSSAYYLLGYTSTLNQPDGKFHKINVRREAPGPSGARAARISGADGHRSRARADAEEGRSAAGCHRSAWRRWRRRRSSAAV